MELQPVLSAACLNLALGLLCLALGRRLGQALAREREREGSLAARVELVRAALLVTLLLGLLPAVVGVYAGRAPALALAAVGLVASLTGLRQGLGQAPPPPPPRRAPTRKWPTQPDACDAFELLARGWGAEVTGDDTRRIHDPDRGALLLEARQLGERVALTLRAAGRRGATARLVLTPAAWRAQQHLGRPLPPELAGFGPLASARIEALLGESGVRRLVLGPGPPQLELALTPRLRLESLRARPPAGLDRDARPAELLAAHLRGLHETLGQLAADGVSVTATQTAPLDPGLRCPYCRDELAHESELARCGRCATVHHAVCWEEARGCTVLGCGARRAARTRVG